MSNQWGDKKIIGFSRSPHPPEKGDYTLFLGKKGVKPGTRIDINHEEFVWLTEGVILGPVDDSHNQETFSLSERRAGKVLRIGRGAYKVRILEVY